MSACLGLAAIVVSLFAMPWFHLRMDVSADLFGGASAAQAAALVSAAKIEIGLRSLSSCNDGVCTSESFSQMSGLYPTIAPFTFWASLVLCVVVAWQTVQRVFGGQANAALSRTGYFIAMAVVVGALFAGFFIQPETASNELMSIVVVRTWGPALMLVGSFIGMYALYLAAVTDVFSDAPVVIPVIPVVVRPRAPEPSQPIVPIAKLRVPDSISLEPSSSDARSEPVRSRPPSEPQASAPPKRASAPLIDLAPKPLPPLAGQLRFAAARAMVGDAAFIVEHENGDKRRVLWADVVGVVARRLPAEAPYSGETFVDIVSTAGATVRIVPWTELSIAGELDTTDETTRARTLVQLISARCPEARVDGATRTFLGGRGEAAQLPNAATLTQHDDRLA